MPGLCVLRLPCTPGNLSADSRFLGAMIPHPDYMTQTSQRMGTAADASLGKESRWVIAHLSQGGEENSEGIPDFN